MHGVRPFSWMFTAGGAFMGAKNAASLRASRWAGARHALYLEGAAIAARSLRENLLRPWSAENCIKNWKRHLASDRTSCSKANANQMRLMIHQPTAMWTLRAACPKRSRWRRSFDTLRLNLIRIAELVRRKHGFMSCPRHHIKACSASCSKDAPPHSA